MDKWLQLNIRAASIKSCVVFKKARKPAYQVEVELPSQALDVQESEGQVAGQDTIAMAIKRSSAQLVGGYPDGPDTLPGRVILVCTNLGVRKIAGFESQVLCLGTHVSEDRVLLAGIEDRAALVPGARAIVEGRQAEGDGVPAVASFEPVARFGTLVPPPGPDDAQQQPVRQVDFGPEVGQRRLCEHVPTERLAPLKSGFFVVDGETAWPVTINGHHLTVPDAERQGTRVANGSPLE